MVMFYTTNMSYSPFFLHFLFWHFSRPRHVDDAKGFTGYCFEQRVGWGGVREGVAAPAVRIEKAIHGE